MAGGLPLGEVGGPEDAAAPGVDLAAGSQLAGQDGFAGGVVPAAVEVDKTGLAGRQSEVAVGFINQPAGALAFEVEDYV